MIELDYQLGFPFPPAVIFAALANVADYPAWQSDVLAARVHGGGPARPGAEVSVVRSYLASAHVDHLRLPELPSSEQPQGKAS